MGNVPENRLEQIVWFENHLPLWSAKPGDFGVTSGQLLALSDAVAAARLAHDRAMAARQASLHATVALREQSGAMLDVGRNLVGVIKAFIADGGDPSLWGRAGIEPPASPGGPGSGPAPTAPFMLSAALDSLGGVVLRWKARQPASLSGVTYSILRALDVGAGAGVGVGVGEFVLLDAVGGKVFVDDTVPEGVRSVSYIVRARHGRKMSPPSESVTIRFGRTDQSTRTTGVRARAA